MHKATVESPVWVSGFRLAKGRYVKGEEVSNLGEEPGPGPVPLLTRSSAAGAFALHPSQFTPPYVRPTGTESSSAARG